MNAKPYLALPATVVSGPTRGQTLPNVPQHRIQRIKVFLVDHNELPALLTKQCAPIPVMVEGSGMPISVVLDPDSEERITQVQAKYP